MRQLKKVNEVENKKLSREYGTETGDKFSDIATDLSKIEESLRETHTKIKELLNLGDIEDAGSGWKKGEYYDHEVMVAWRAVIEALWKLDDKVVNLMK